MATNNVSVATSGSKTYELHSAILLYRARGGNAIQTGDVYATLHGVRRGKRGAELDVGVPATVEACGGFVRAIADRAAFAGFLSPNLLYVGPRTVAWWRPPSPARVWFKTEDAENPKRHIGERSAVTPQPGLVFVVRDGCWYVLAVKGDKRPEPTTPLFRAPYFNVWIDARICEGNLRRPERVTPETIARFEQAFFESRFTHTNIPRAQDITRHPGGVYALWRSLLEGKFRAFPEKSLVPHGKATLETQLRTLEAKR